MAFIGKSAHIPFANPGQAKQHKILKNLEDTKKSCTHDIENEEKDKRQFEKIYRTETNITKHKEESFFSHPNDMMKSIQLTRKTYKPATTISSGSHRDLHRHSIKNDLEAWSAQNQFSEYEKRMIARGHYVITQAMVKSMDDEKEQKSEYSLLPTALEITGKFCDVI